MIKTLAVLAAGYGISRWIKAGNASRALQAPGADGGVLGDSSDGLSSGVATRASAYSPNTAETLQQTNGNGAYAGIGSQLSGDAQRSDNLLAEDDDIVTGGGALDGRANPITPGLPDFARGA